MATEEDAGEGLAAYGSETVGGHGGSGEAAALAGSSATDP